MRPIIAGAIINDYYDADSRGAAPCYNISPLQGFRNVPLFAVMDSRSGAGMTEKAGMTKRCARFACGETSFWRARHWHFAPMRPIIAGAIINDYYDADSRGAAPCYDISPLQGFRNMPLFAVMDSRSGAGMTEKAGITEKMRSLCLRRNFVLAGAALALCA